MLEKHHLGQAMDLHYNINGKLLELKGWCEVIQPAPSLSDRSDLAPHTRQAQGTLLAHGAPAYFRRLTAPPKTPTVVFFFLTRKLTFFFFFKCHISAHMQQPDSICTAGFSFRWNLQRTPRALFFCEWVQRRQGDEQRGGVRGGDAPTQLYNETCFIFYVHRHT